MICLKICTFVVSKTTYRYSLLGYLPLWFAWKSVPLWYLKQRYLRPSESFPVVICLKICTFVVSKTTVTGKGQIYFVLWFAWKSVPLWYLKQQRLPALFKRIVVICLKICTFVVSKTTFICCAYLWWLLWFAWKSVPLWYLKQPIRILGKLYQVVICLKICTFVVSKTTYNEGKIKYVELWFAWKSVPLWYLKQQSLIICSTVLSCDLLENLYLCGI